MRRSRLPESQPSQNPENTLNAGSPQPQKPALENPSRRMLIKGAAEVGKGIIFTLFGYKIHQYIQSEEKTEEPQKIQTIETELHTIESIIRDENMEQAVQNPFIVSALYYSDKFFQDLASKPPESTFAAEVLLAIRKQVPQSFRKKYITFISEKAFSGSNEIRGNVFTRPLRNSSFQADGNHPDALDMFTEEGSNISTMADGIVLLAESGYDPKNPLSSTSPKGGNQVIIFNPVLGEFYRYAHMEKVTAKPLQTIKSGEVIGTVGHTGLNASKPGHGNHLHFEINKYIPQTNEQIATEAIQIVQRLKISH